VIRRSGARDQQRHGWTFEIRRHGQNRVKIADADLRLGRRCIPDRSTKAEEGESGDKPARKHG
jgi:hypothetical protein